MNKEEFLAALRSGLRGLPQEDIDERLAFYEEMINDRIEDGVSEEEAVAGIGSVDDVISQILADVPVGVLVKEKMKNKRRIKGWEIVLLVLGFPLWFPLVISGAAVALALYIVVWALVIALWAIELAFAVSVTAGIIMAVVYFAEGYVISGVAMVGATICCAGFAILMFLGALYASKGVVKLTGKAMMGLKRKLVGKEAA